MIELTCAHLDAFYISRDQSGYVQWPVSNLGNTRRIGSGISLPDKTNAAKSPKSLAEFCCAVQKNVAMQHDLHYVVFADDDKVRRRMDRRKEFAPMIASGLKEMRS